jgi:hypothetical protein
MLWKWREDQVHKGIHWLGWLQNQWSTLQVKYLFDKGETTSDRTTNGEATTTSDRTTNGEATTTNHEATNDGTHDGNCFAMLWKWKRDQVHKGIHWLGWLQNQWSTLQVKYLFDKEADKLQVPEGQDKQLLLGRQAHQGCDEGKNQERIHRLARILLWNEGEPRIHGRMPWQRESMRPQLSQRERRRKSTQATQGKPKKAEGEEGWAKMHNQQKKLQQCWSSPCGASQGHNCDRRWNEQSLPRLG